MAVIRTAMVLAAGRGERLRPLTDTLPKPLIEVGGRTMLDRTLDALADAGVETAVVNVWHLADKIVKHLENRTRPRIVVSREATLLDTGGGVVKALPLLGNSPFYTASPKQLWRDRGRPALLRLAEAFDPLRMDALLLLQPLEKAAGFDGAGDFALAADGRLARRGPYAYTSLQILHPRLLEGAPRTGPFSLNLLWDKAISAGRLYGLVHEGEWCHVSTPAGLAAAETWLKAAGG